MKRKKPESESDFCQAGRRPTAEKRTEAFYTELQQAIDDVDWGSVVVPKLSDCRTRKSTLRPESPNFNAAAALKCNPNLCPEKLPSL